VRVSDNADGCVDLGASAIGMNFIDASPRIVDLATARAIPDGLQVLQAVNVRVAPGKILIPDLVVVSKPGADLVVWDPDDVVMAIEIVSRGSVAMDRAVKPQLYAAARIRYYLRIELCSPGPSARQYRRVGDRYLEIVHAEPHERLRLTGPFALDVDLAALAAATRPSDR